MIILTVRKHRGFDLLKPIRGVMHVTRAMCGNQLSIGMNLWDDKCIMALFIFCTWMRPVMIAMDKA